MRVFGGALVWLGIVVMLIAAIASDANTAPLSIVIVGGVIGLAFLFVGGGVYNRY